jgi:hypothetical protein
MKPAIFCLEKVYDDSHGGTEINHEDRSCLQQEFLRMKQCWYPFNRVVPFDYRKDVHGLNVAKVCKYSGSNGYAIHFRKLLYASVIS